MALARSWAVALVGVEGHVVEVVAHLSSGVPGLSITGLPDASLNEARDRVRAAIGNSRLSFPDRKIILGLSPAALPKRGSSFDLALAAALLAADDQVPASALQDVLLLGELGLDGRVRSVPGVLPAMVAWTASEGRRRAVVPWENLAEAQLLPEADVIGVGSLAELVAVLRGEEPGRRTPPPVPARGDGPAVGDYLEVAGQPEGRIACEVAAAGGHNLLMTGPPGCGKTLLAQRMPGILPLLSLEESLEVSAIHSVAGVLRADAPLVTHAPFQAPHHATSMAAMVGGGAGIARPGAVSLAHRGLLFLDEAPEFSRQALDALRQPLEEGCITLQRVGGAARYPARFALVLAANPCPCAQPSRSCTCPPERRRSYLTRLSGPLLDRIDLQVGLPAITRKEVLAEGGVGEATAVMAARVGQARDRAAARLAGTPYRTNADVPGPVLKRHWPLPRGAVRVAGDAIDKGILTGRGFDRVLRLAWTLADLEGVPTPTEGHVVQALGLRLGASWTRAAAA